jgi:hypothetical protein
LNRAFVVIGAILVCAIPCALLFNVRSIFFFDWINHLWSIEYFGEYLKSHHRFPAVFNTDPVVGIPVPIFYAYIFYAITGALAALVGSAWVLRVIVPALFFMQFVVAYRVLARRSGPEIAFASAAIVTWAIYPLTNLYNRSAITEFVAVVFLTCCVAALVSLVFEVDQGRHPLRRSLGPGLFYALAAVTHPLTAIFGALLIALIGLVALIVSRSLWLALYAAANVLMVGLILSPWLYANSVFAGAMQVSEAQFNRHAFQVMGFFPDSLDSLWSRLSPVPLDKRSLIQGAINVSTPYLDAQIMVPLCLVLSALVLATLWRGRKRFDALSVAIAVVSIILAIFFTALSVKPAISNYFGELFNVLQYAYRLTTYINLAVLVAVIALGSAGRSAQTGRTWAVLCLSFGMALSGVVSKLQHAYSIRQSSSEASVARIAGELRIPEPAVPRSIWFPGMPNEGPSATNLPPTYYGYPAYSVFAGYSAKRPSAGETVKRVLFKVREHPFGEIQPVQVHLDLASLVITNIQPFPWNQLIVNSKRQPVATTVAVPQGNLPVYAQMDGVSINLGPRDYTMSYAFAPPPRWVAMTLLSWGCLLGWVGCLLGYGYGTFG